MKVYRSVHQLFSSCLVNLERNILASKFYYSMRMDRQSGQGTHAAISVTYQLTVVPKLIVDTRRSTEQRSPLQHYLLNSEVETETTGVQVQFHRTRSVLQRQPTKAILSDTMNNSTPTKHTILIRGLPVTFVTSSPIDKEHLEKFLESHIEQLPSTNNSVHLRFEQILQHQNRTIIAPDDLNNAFIEFAHFVISAIYFYDQNTRSNTYAQKRKIAPSTKSYVFKVPKKPKSTVFDKHWKDHFHELENFKKKFGHCNVSRSTKGYDQLGNWVADQRRKLRRGKLTEQQYEMLTELGMDWDRAEKYGQSVIMLES